MLVKSQGCPLHHIKYRDSGLLVYTYTRDYGFQTLFVQGIRNKKGSKGSSIYQPLYLLDIDFYYHQKRDIHRIKEARIQTPFHSIPFNVYKSTIVLFLAEILYKCLKTQETAPSMYDFIAKAMEYLDQIDDGITNFHLVFLLELSKHLGFYPNLSGARNFECFDLREGIFREVHPNHPFYIPQKYAYLLRDLLNVNFDSMAKVRLDQTDRNTLVEHLLDYFQLHQENLKHVQSYKVLKSLFNK